MTGIEEYSIILENLVSIFTVERGVLKVLLMRKKNDPYKGYWILPSSIITNKETLEDSLYTIVQNRLGLPKIYLEQGHIFSGLDRDPDERIVGISYIGLIDYQRFMMKREEKNDIEFSLFDIENIPKMGYDHEEVVKDSIKILRKKLLNCDVLKNLFPSDFTLPEIQRVYEQILGHSLDRRNFRKKFVNLGIVVDTGERNIGGNGRPGKLYRLSENLKDRDLF